MWSAPQVVRPRLIKWLAAFCVLECVGAATSPSSPAPKFGAAMIDGGEGPGSGEGSPPFTCGCPDELEAMAVLHAAELQGVREEFEVKLEGVRGEFNVKLEGIHQFLSMTPPSSPPSPPPSPSPPPVRDCAASPCTDGYWQTETGIGCAFLRGFTVFAAVSPSAAADYPDAEGRLAGDSCCQFCPPASPSSPPPPLPPRAGPPLVSLPTDYFGSA